MKKGLYLTLALVTIAFLSTSAYGVTLTIDEIPDIIIGDMEAFDSEAAAQSQDTNLFEYTGVFVFDDVLTFSDGGTTFSEVKWSYAEFDDLLPTGTLQAPGNNWIEVNETDPLANTALIWNPVADISQTPDANFRNIALSPPPGDYYSAPSAEYLGAEGARVINFYATYNVAPIVTSDTETVIVYTVDNVYDSVSFALWSEDFESGDASGWTWWSANFDVLNVVSEGQGDMAGTSDYALSMTSDDTVANRGSTTDALAYGFWHSPDTDAESRIDYTSGKLYKIRWHLVSSESAAVDQPGLRVRAQSALVALSGAQVLQQGQGTAKHPQISSDANDPSEYDMYWYPAPWLVDAGLVAQPALGGFSLYADMWDNINTVTGSWYIPKVEVFELDPPAAATPVFSAPTFDTAVWRDITTLGSGMTSTLNASGGLTINYADVGGESVRLRYWEFFEAAAPHAVMLNANKLYRMTIEVTSTGNTPPVLRPRLITGNSYLESDTVLTPAVPQGSTFTWALPGSSAKELVTYLPITDDFLTDDWLLWSMDTYGPIVSGTADPYTGSYTITSVEIEELDTP